MASSVARKPLAGFVGYRREGTTTSRASGEREQHFQRLGDQLRRLGFVITSGVKEGAGEKTKIPATPKYRRGRNFLSGPGATRTRDLLLRSRPRPATASDHQRNHLVSPRTPGTRPPRILVLDVGGCLRPHLPTVGIARGCHHGDHPRGPAQAGGGRPVSVHPGKDVDASRPHGGLGAEASRGVRTPSTGATSGARRGRLSLPRWPSPSARCSHAPDGSGARSNGTSLLTRVEDGPPSAGGNSPKHSAALCSANFGSCKWLGCGLSEGIRRRASPDGTPGNISSGPHRRGLRKPLRN